MKEVREVAKQTPEVRAFWVERTAVQRQKSVIYWRNSQELSGVGEDGHYKDLDLTVSEVGNHSEVLIKGTTYKNNFHGMLVREGS